MNVRQTKPLVHVITNDITAESVVNTVLALGGSAIGATAPEEVREITAQADGLLLNCGTPSAQRMEAIRLAGLRANESGIPIVLDPVGVGASTYRKEFLQDLLERIHVDCIRGNAAEIRTLANLISDIPQSQECGMNAPGRIREDASCRAGRVLERGVDTDADMPDQKLLMKLSELLKCIVIVSGSSVQVASYEDDLYRCLPGGSILQKSMTGAGCMMSAMLAVYLAAGHQQGIRDSDAVMEAVSLYTGCARRAERCVDDEIRRIGTETYRHRLIDGLSRTGFGYRMRFMSSDLRLYAVTDRQGLHLSLEEAVEAAVRGGATMVQLREKQLQEEDFIREARQIKAICDRYDVPLIINDSISVCKAVGAAGVHLGQSDTEIVRARQELGEGVLIGATAHNLQEALAAQAQGADYLGVGAAFGSSTKQDAVEVKDLRMYREIADEVRIPIVAIGGITADNVGYLYGSHIAGVAVIKGIFGALDIEEQAKQFKNKTKEEFFK